MSIRTQKVATVPCRERHVHGMEGNVCDIAGRTSPRDKGKDLTAQDQSHPLSSVSQIRSAISTFEKQGEDYQEQSETNLHTRSGC